MSESGEPLKLEGDECSLHEELKKIYEQIIKALQTPSDSKDPKSLLNQAGETAHQLHTKLTDRDEEPPHQPYMIRNRGMSSDHPDFYKHLHPIEDLLSWIEAPNSIEISKDTTIDQEFTFTIEKTWRDGPLNIKLKRTPSGWEVSSLGYPVTRTNRGGVPYFYYILDQEKVSYPADLKYNLEGVWKNGANGSSFEELQEEVSALDKWVSGVDASNPCKHKTA